MNSCTQSISALSYHPNVIRLIGYTEFPHTIVTPLYEVTDL